VILLLDNYDSFVHNLARYLRELGEEVTVRRNDRIDLEEARRTAPSHLVVSPGPCTPAEAGRSNEIVRELSRDTPTLGVCLGHQCVGEVFGGRVVRAARPMHGKLSEVHHAGQGLFTGIPSPFRATRYHSLVLDPDRVPPALEVVAWSRPRVEGASSDGAGASGPETRAGDDPDAAGETESGAREIMAVRHRERPAWGVQFHPEAVRTEHGHALLANFLALGRGEPPPGPEGVRPAPELARVGEGR